MAVVTRNNLISKEDVLIRAGIVSELKDSYFGSKIGEKGNERMR